MRQQHDNGPPPGGGASRVIADHCFMCQGSIDVMEPFQLALVFDADGNLVNIAYHQACELDAVATAMGDELEAMEQGTRAESIGVRLRDLVVELFERLDNRR